jgi:hypothetical protein
MPGDFGDLAVNTRVHFTTLMRTRGCGCAWRPAFPTPSVFRGGEFLQHSGVTRRGNADAYLSMSSRPSEARAGTHTPCHLLLEKKEQPATCPIQRPRIMGPGSEAGTTRRGRRGNAGGVFGVGRHCEERTRRSNPHFRCCAMDCFAEPASGAHSRDRWLAMTGSATELLGCLKLNCAAHSLYRRHPEEAA